MVRYLMTIAVMLVPSFGTAYWAYRLLTVGVPSGALVGLLSVGLFVFTAQIADRDP